jgi:hypothetical protein
MNQARQNLIQQIDKLKAEHREREMSLPAHSLQPHQLLIIEELEDKIRELEEKLRLLDQGKDSEEAK